MSTLLEVLQQADARKFAVGHFNVSDLVTLYGIVEAARQRGLPVVVGASEAERRFIGVQQLVAIVKSLQMGPRKVGKGIGNRSCQGTTLEKTLRDFAKSIH